MQHLLESLKNSKYQESTRKVYHQIWNSFNKFIIRLDSLPRTWEERTSLYCTYLVFEKKLQSSTIKTYVSAIKAVLTDDDYDWCDDKVLLNTITRSCKLKNDIVKTRLPILMGLLNIILFEVKKTYDMQPYLQTMYITAFLIMYYGLFRVGEIAESPHSIKAVDIHESRGSNKLLIVLYSSKTHGRNSAPQKVKISGKNYARGTKSGYNVNNNS